MRRYARGTGLALLSLDGACVPGVGTANPVAGLESLFVGGLLAYAGFRWDEERFVRVNVGGLGGLHLLSGLLAFVARARLFGGLPKHLARLAFGLSNVAAVAFTWRGAAPAGEAPEHRDKRHRASARSGRA